MKQIDIGPNEYRRQAKDGAWVNPDEPVSLTLGLIMDFAALGYLFWRREEMIGHELLMAVLVGIFLLSAALLGFCLIRVLNPRFRA